MHHRLRYQFPGCVLISALTKEGINDLQEAIKEKIAQTWQQVSLRLNYAEADIRALILKRGRLIKETYGANYMTLRVELPPKIIGRIKHWRAEKKKAGK